MKEKTKFLVCFCWYNRFVILAHCFVTSGGRRPSFLLAVLTNCAARWMTNRRRRRIVIYLLIHSCRAAFLNGRAQIYLNDVEGESFVQGLARLLPVCDVCVRDERRRPEEYLVVLPPRYLVTLAVTWICITSWEIGHIFSLIRAN